MTAEDDPVFSDAVFLANHPGWTPTDLANASEELLEVMAMLTNASAAVVARERAAEKGATRTRTR